MMSLSHPRQRHRSSNAPCSSKRALAAHSPAAGCGTKKISSPSSIVFGPGCSVATLYLDCISSRFPSATATPATHSAVHAAGGLSVSPDAAASPFGSQGHGCGQLTLQVGALDIRLADRPIRRRAVGDREAVLCLRPASESWVSAGNAKGVGEGGPMRASCEPPPPCAQQRSMCTPSSQDQGTRKRRSCCWCARLTDYPGAPHPSRSPP